MSGKTTAIAAGSPVALIVVVMAIVLVMGGSVIGTPTSHTHVPGNTELNEQAVPAWARQLLHTAATVCPEVTAPLLAAQIEIESGWDPGAYNEDSKAEGLAQFVPGTWAQFGVDGDGDHIADVRNPEDAIPSQARYLCHLISFVTRTPGLTGELVDLALASYNAGPGTVQNHRGIPPFPETTHYVTAVRHLANTKYAVLATGIDQVIQAAAAHVDTTMYSWGGGTLNGPSPGQPPDAGIIGFDCSALVRYAYHQGTQHTITLPRTSQQQYTATRTQPVAIPDLEPGDLLFWGTPTTIHHVALYVGDGQMFEAPQSGQEITKTDIRTNGDYLGATRVFNGPLDPANRT